MELNRDITGYEIGPHTDGSGKWVSDVPTQPHYLVLGAFVSHKLITGPVVTVGGLFVGLGMNSGEYIILSAQR